MKSINVIYNPYHPDPERQEKLLRELDWQGIVELTDLYPCVRLSESVEASINASHKMLVRMAKQAKLDEVVIMEDDVHFPAPDGFFHWMRQKPKTFDIYLAGTYGSRNGDVVPYPIGLHCYIIHSRFYDKFLSIDPTKHIDIALEGLGIFKICYPYCAIQRPGFSSNKRANVDYNTILQVCDIYTGSDGDFFTTFPDY